MGLGQPPCLLLLRCGGRAFGSEAKVPRLPQPSLQPWHPGPATQAEEVRGTNSHSALGPQPSLLGTKPRFLVGGWWALACSQRGAAPREAVS